MSWFNIQRQLKVAFLGAVGCYLWKIFLLCLRILTHQDWLANGVRWGGANLFIRPMAGRLVFGKPVWKWNDHKKKSMNWRLTQSIF